MIEIAILASIGVNITLGIALIFSHSSYKDEKEKEVILLNRINEILEEKDAAIETALKCISDTSKSFSDFINEKENESKSN